jgi:RNA polymerase sigma factor (sigma-70 family)
VAIGPPVRRALWREDLAVRDRPAAGTQPPAGAITPAVPLDGLAGWADPAPGPAEWAIANAWGEAIADAFDALALHHREVLALAFAARVPHREIAEILGVPVGTVKSRLHHARAALARALADRGYVEEMP